jgi:hypothetical protein
MTHRRSGSGRSRRLPAQENKPVSWRLQEEVFGQGKLELVAELLASNYVSLSRCVWPRGYLHYAVYYGARPRPSGGYLVSPTVYPRGGGGASTPVCYEPKGLEEVWNSRKFACKIMDSLGP